MKLLAVRYWRPPVKNELCGKINQFRTPTSGTLINYKNPGPVGLVRVKWLCQLYVSMLLNDQVVPTTKDQGVTNEPIPKVITMDMALPVSYCVGAKNRYKFLKGMVAVEPGTGYLL